MSGDILLFHSYKTCLNNHKDKIADGIGNFIISKDITLNDVLFVPKFSCNLLSINKMTRDYNCIAKFSPTSCELQVLNRGG